MQCIEQQDWGVGNNAGFGWGCIVSYVHLNRAVSVCTAATDQITEGCIGISGGGSVLGSGAGGGWWWWWWWWVG